MTVVPKWRVRAWVPLVALAYGVIAFVPPLLLLQKAKGTPPIHDITTDPFDPPAFKALMPVRQQVSERGRVRRHGGREAAEPGAIPTSSRS